MKKLSVGKIRLSTRRFLRIEVGFDFKDEADIYRFRGFVVAFVPNAIRYWAAANMYFVHALTIYVCCFFIRFRWDARTSSCMNDMTSTV